MRPDINQVLRDLIALLERNPGKLDETTARTAYKLLGITIDSQFGEIEQLREDVLRLKQQLWEAIRLHNKDETHRLGREYSELCDKLVAFWMREAFPGIKPENLATWLTDNWKIKSRWADRIQWAVMRDMFDPRWLVDLGDSQLGFKLQGINRIGELTAITILEARQQWRAQQK